MSTAPDAVLRLSGAAVAVGGRTLWSGVDLTVAPGEFVAVLGANGAGKSTMVRALLGQVPLARGSAEVLGRPVRAGNPQIGYLPQRRSIDPALRVRGVDVVRLGVDVGAGGCRCRVRGGGVRGPVPRRTGCARSSPWWGPRPTRTARSVSSPAVSSNGC